MKVLRLLLFSVLVSLCAAQCDDTLPSGKKCGAEDEILEADPEACSYYYDCYHGCVYREQCFPLPQDGLPRVFDEGYGRCAYTEYVDCAPRPCLDEEMCVTNPPTTTTTTTPDCGHFADCTALGNGYHPDPYNCRKYWHCYRDGGEHLICPNDPQTGVPEVFDLVYNGCNYQELTDCGDRPVCDECDNNCVHGPTTTTSSDCSSHDPLDCSSKPTGWYADQYNCRKYWHCNGDNAQHFLCDTLAGNKQLQYNDALIECDYDDRVDCGKRPVCDDCDKNCKDDGGGGGDADCGPDDHHPPDICHGKPDGWYPDIFNCQKYWHCSAGQGEHFLCPDGELYEMTKVQCDWPNRVNCGGRPICDHCDENCHH